jgi:general secretion pathway protein M
MTCELVQVDILQRVLHDLESGMPFLFVDELSVQTPSQQDHQQKLRVRFAISALWTGAK